MSKGQISLTCQFQRFLYQTLCVFSQIKDRKHIEQNFHSVAKVMPRDGTAGSGGVKNFSMGIWDGAPSTARSSFFPIVMFYESVPIKTRCRYEYSGELAQFGWNPARIHYD